MTTMPVKAVYPDATPAEWERFYSYNRQDVEALKAAWLWCRSHGWTEREMGTYWLTTRMNERGVCVDVELAKHMGNMLERVVPRMHKEIKELTGGDVERTTQRDRILKWLDAEGVELPNLQKATIENVLIDEDVLLPPHVERVLRLRQMGSKASIAKLQALHRRAVNGRLYNEFVYRGARATGRWSSYGVQLQNIRRETLDHKLAAIELIHSENIDMLEDVFQEPLVECISKALRFLIVSDADHTLYWGDYTGIEARVIRWISNDEHGLAIFREGEDPYVDTASRIYNVPKEEVTKDQRQIGKIAELSLGFQGGERALTGMARSYGVHINVVNAKRIVNTWRSHHQDIVHTWRLFEAAFRTTLQRRCVAEIRKGYRYYYDEERHMVHLELPSGLTLPYPRARFTEQGDLMYTAIKGGNAVEVSLYGGKLFQHSVQSTAREVLADAMKRVETAGFLPVATVHDEVVCELRNSGFDNQHDRFTDLLLEQPEWCPGLPIDATVYSDDRYGK